MPERNFVIVFAFRGG